MKTKSKERQEQEDLELMSMSIYILLHGCMAAWRAWLRAGLYPFIRLARHGKRPMHPTTSACSLCLELGRWLDIVAWGVWRLAFGVWRLAFGVCERHADVQKVHKMQMMPMPHAEQSLDDMDDTNSPG
jgi:hypothetical protein